ncbi:MAG: hypothetical protein AAGK97_18945, partial [Bacteroidota bacterium]
MKTFQNKQDIKKRLIAEAIRSWALKDSQASDIENFDPIVNIMIGALSHELEKLYYELGESRKRIFERMVNILTPEVLMEASPAHMIMQARPSEATHFTHPEDQFYCKSLNLRKDLYFAPLEQYKIYNANVKYLAYGSKVFEVNKLGEKELFMDSSYGYSLDSGRYFIGI